MEENAPSVGWSDRMRQTLRGRHRKRITPINGVIRLRYVTQSGLLNTNYDDSGFRLYVMGPMMFAVGLFFALLDVAELTRIFVGTMAGGQGTHGHRSLLIGIVPGIFFAVCGYYFMASRDTLLLQPSAGRYLHDRGVWPFNLRTEGALDQFAALTITGETRISQRQNTTTDVWAVTLSAKRGHGADIPLCILDLPTRFFSETEARARFGELAKALRLPRKEALSVKD